MNKKLEALLKYITVIGEMLPTHIPQYFANSDSVWKNTLISRLVVQPTTTFELVDIVPCR